MAKGSSKKKYPSAPTRDVGAPNAWLEVAALADLFAGLGAEPVPTTKQGFRQDLELTDPAFHGMATPLTAPRPAGGAAQPQGS